MSSTGRRAPLRLSCTLSSKHTSLLAISHTSTFYAEFLPRQGIITTPIGRGPRRFEHGRSHNLRPEQTMVAICK